MDPYQTGGWQPRGEPLGAPAAPISQHPYPSSPPPAGHPLGPSPPPAPAFMPIPRPRRRRGGLLVGLVATVAVVVLGGGTALALATRHHLTATPAAQVAASTPTTNAAAASPTPPPSPTAAAVKVPAKFSTPRAIANLLTKLGAPCPRYVDEPPVDPHSDFGPPGLRKVGNCANDAISISIFDSHPNAWGDYEYLVALLGSASDVHLAIGGNWALSADDPGYAQQAAQLLHGTYRSG